MKKYFVLDTNVLLHNPDAINSFADNVVIVPMDVIEELDIFKKDTNELGRNARTAIRALDRLKARGKLGEGVSLDNGGTLQVLTEVDLKGPFGLTTDNADNRILAIALGLQRGGNRVVFVSKDFNVRVKADALGVQSVDFEKEKVDFDKLYCGFSEAALTEEELSNFKASGKLKYERSGLFANQFVILKDTAAQTQAAIAKYRGGNLIALRNAAEFEVWGIRPRNKEQTMALELLLSDEIKLVTLVGRAGTGKTLLALAAALKKTIDDRAYRRILVSRPIVPLGKDIGYLPGTKEEKITHWMQPIYDNLEYILSVKKKKLKELDDLMESGLIQLEALTYMRGRSIPGQFIIIDEAQNLTPHEVKTIISRAGSHTKMVLTGDPYQIDNPYLDSSSNGLTYAAECLKGQEMVGHILLTKNERSALASMAAELL